MITISPGDLAVLAHQGGWDEVLLVGGPIVVIIAVPAAIGLVLLASPLLVTLFYGGIFARLDVDMAAISGGNCELSEAGQTVERHGVTIMGPDNLPATIPVHASQMYGKNVVTFLLEMIQDGELVVDLENDVVGPACLSHGGEVQNERVRSALGLAPLAPPAETPEATTESADSGE